MKRNSEPIFRFSARSPIVVLQALSLVSLCGLADLPAEPAGSFTLEFEDLENELPLMAL